MAFPNVIVECAFNNILSERMNAPSGFTDVTRYVESVSGTLRGRAYELDEVETGSITVALDNADGRFTPGSELSPYFPHVRANRRFRIRGKNMQRLNIARGGGQDWSTEGFFKDDSSVLVGAPVLATHSPVTLGLSGALLDESRHVEATIKVGATAGTYRVLSWWCPIELGVRLTHSAYVWRVSGTEPSGTSAHLVNSYYDADGNEIEKAAGDTGLTWSVPTASAPVRRVCADLPPGNAAYAIQSLVLTTTNTTTTDVVYAVTGTQSEISSNLAPSISGYYDAAAWEMAGDGAVTQSSTDPATVYVLVTWDAADTELRMTIPHLVPGDDYTFVVEAYRSGGPSILLTGDDGLTGATLSDDDTWATLRVSFTASRDGCPVKVIPQGTPSGTLRLRLARCVTGTDPTLALATSANDTDETDWERPIPIFDGWVERWPSAGPTVNVTVNDRMKKLGEVTMESTLNQVLITDAPALLIPFTDEASADVVSFLGDWSDDMNVAGLTPRATKYGPGSSTFELAGAVGPAGEDVVDIAPESDSTGYSLPIPYSYDFFTPAPVPGQALSPIPDPPAIRAYTSTYYATWSRSYDGAGTTRYSDPAYLYQGDSGDGNGNQRALIGFNYAAIAADLAGTSVVSAWLSLYAVHWWEYAGGTGYIGTHDYASKPSSCDVIAERQWARVRWPRNSWRTVDVGAVTGILFQTAAVKGIVVGPGDAGDPQSYGYFAGATTSQRPFLTITYKK